MDPVNERLQSAVAELTGLLAELEAEIPHKPTAGHSGAGGGGGERPLAAWNTPAAMLAMDIHAGVRELDAGLCYLLTGRMRPRGGGSAVTIALLGALPALAAGAPEKAAEDATRRVEGWCWRAKVVLGEREEWKHLPRLPGRPAPRCPFCRFTTLRYKPSGVLRCINPACRDGNGSPPVARVEFGAATGEPLFIWQDSTSGVGHG